MKRLRVLQVLEATAGGTRRHLQEIITYLDRTRFELRVVCATRRDARMQEDLALFRALGVDVEIVDMVRRPAPLSDLAAAWALRASLRRRPADVIHLHSSKAGFVGRLAAVGLSVPIVYSPHGFPFLQPGLIGHVSWLAERALARRATTLLAVSRAEGRLATSAGLFEPERVSVIENAVAAPREAPRRRRREGPITFGFLGELREQKDPLTFLEAAHRSMHMGLRARFVMPERGPWLATVRKRVARLGLESVVDLVAAEDSLNLVHARCDVGVLPSRWEGLPYALLDSMALAKPVITSSLDVFRDVVEPLDRTLLFETGDASALSRRFLHWSSLPSHVLHAVGDAGRRLMTRSHRMEPWSDQLAELYSTASGGHDGRNQAWAHRATRAPRPVAETMHVY